MTNVFTLIHSVGLAYPVRNPICTQCVRLRIRFPLILPSACPCSASAISCYKQNADPLHETNAILCVYALRNNAHNSVCAHWGSFQNKNKKNKTTSECPFANMLAIGFRLMASCSLTRSQCLDSNIKCEKSKNGNQVAFANCRKHWMHAGDGFLIGLAIASRTETEIEASPVPLHAWLAVCVCASFSNCSSQLQ